ncbi:MAG: sigma-54 dependent transcriptional regulator [Dysgonamonadaceae bacterium]|nr:sigma-54 dependent transcriptional regulator [Dysgonamonadaceae bacterium]
MGTILIVEDDLTLSLMLKTCLSKKGFTVVTSLTVSEAKKSIAGEQPEIILLDLRLPDENGMTLLKWVKEQYPAVIVIMMTGYADITSAVESIKSGAFDYVSKPLHPEELFDKIHHAFAQRAMTKSEKEDEKPQELGYVRGHSPEYQRLYEYIDLVAPTKLSVFIHGNSGVGKEHVARLIHEKSDRAAGPFVAVDCGVLSRELAASEFFGHIKGAFTGAINNKAGCFQTANRGTLFLDEIGNLPLDIQAQLLRVLQEKIIKPVGGEKEIPVDVRLIAATNKEIDHSSPHASFRLDLYHRLNEFSLRVPSLAECREDIVLFAHHFLELSNEELKKNIIGFTSEALEILSRYAWPGNIRELRNVINQLTLTTRDAYITADIIPDTIKSSPVEPLKAAPIRQSNEKERIEEALRYANNNKTKAAQLLNIDRKTLYNKLKLFGIDA